MMCHCCNTLILCCTEGEKKTPKERETLQKFLSKWIDELKKNMEVGLGPNVVA